MEFVISHDTYDGYDTFSRKVPMREFIFRFRKVTGNAVICVIAS